MRTTLDLPDETFRQLKAQAALNGMKLKELVTQLIQKSLASGDFAPMPMPPLDSIATGSQRLSVVTVTAASAPQAQTPQYPIPIAREADGSVTPYLSNAQLNDLLDGEDLAQYQRVTALAARP